MLTEADLAFRRRHLCSSDIASAANVGPFAAPIQLWEAKVLGLDWIPDPDEAERLEIGHEVEPVIATLYARRTGATLRTLAPIEHPKLPWVAATPDREVVGTKGLLECKAVGVKSAPFWGEPSEGPNGIPDHYLAQVAWQMAVTGAEWVDVGALLGTELRIYRIERDRTLEAELLEAGRRFWFRHVVPQIAPQVDGTDACSAYLARRFPRRDARAELLPMTMPAAAALLEYREASAAVEQQRDRQARAKNILCALIGAAGVEGFRDPELGTVTWKKTASGGVAWQALAEDLREQLGFALEELRQLAPERVHQIRTPAETWTELLARHARPGFERLDQRAPRKSEPTTKRVAEAARASALPARRAPKSTVTDQQEIAR